MSFDRERELMYAVVKIYSDLDAGELFHLLEESKEEIEGLIRSISGFQAYTKEH